MVFTRCATRTQSFAVNLHSPRVLITDFGSSAMLHENWLRTRSGHTGTMEVSRPQVEKDRVRALNQCYSVSVHGPRVAADRPEDWYPTRVVQQGRHVVTR